MSAQNAVIAKELSGAGESRTNLEATALDEANTSDNHDTIAEAAEDDTERAEDAALPDGGFALTAVFLITAGKAVFHGNWWSGGGWLALGILTFLCTMASRRIALAIDYLMGIAVLCLFLYGFWYVLSAVYSLLLRL